MSLLKGLGRAARQTLGDSATGIGDVLGALSPAGFIGRIAEQCEAIEVRVMCRPHSDDINDYHIEADLSVLEAAMAEDRFVRPQIIVHAVSDKIDRDILTERLLVDFGEILKGHEARMQDVKVRLEQKVARQRAETDFNLLSLGFDIIVAGATLAMLGLSALVGPLLWLMVGIGGLAVLAELPSLAMSLIKRALGFKVYACADEEELDQLKAELEKYRPLLQKLVRDLDIVVDESLAIA